MKNKFSIAMSLAVILAMLIASFVLADDISNNLDSSVDAIAEVMPLNVGGPVGTTQLYVVERNGDGKNGCNFQGSETLVVSVSSSNNSVATVSPSSLTFGSCGDMRALTLTAVATGSATISISQTSNTTGDAFNLSTATFTVNVAPPANTAPTVTISGVTGGASYEFGSVPAATCQVMDTEDGNSSFAATISGVSGPLSEYGLGEQTASCEYTDGGGLIASASVTYGIVDTIAPTLSFPVSLSAEATSASGAAVSFNASATDVVDPAPVVTCTPASGSTFALGTTTVSCTAKDVAGNTSAAETFNVSVVDTTGPTVNVPANVTTEATGPSGAAVGFTATASDLVDGALTPSCSPASGSTFPISTTTVTCSATDAAGNTGSATFTVKVQDTTAPALTLPSNMTVDATSAAGAVVTYITSASDIVDGSVAVTCTPASGSTFAAGTTAVNCSATDAAGNEATGSFTVSVKFRLSGFYQPVDMTTGSTIVWNTVKNGSTVPLKFEIFAGSTELTATSLINQPLKATSVSCVGNTVDEIELTATGSTSLRYDTTGGQFIYNWQTPKQVGACYKVTVTTSDGSSIFAYFKLK